jgi:hypothetical protein
MIIVFLKAGLVYEIKEINEIKIFLNQAFPKPDEKRY